MSTLTAYGTDRLRRLRGHAAHATRALCAVLTALCTTAAPAAQAAEPAPTQAAYLADRLQENPVYIALVPQLPEDESAGDSELFAAAVHHRVGRDGVYVVADPFNGTIDVINRGLRLDSLDLYFDLPESIAYGDDAADEAADHLMAERLDRLMTYLDESRARKRQRPSPARRPRRTLARPRPCPRCSPDRSGPGCSWAPWWRRCSSWSCPASWGWSPGRCGGAAQSRRSPSPSASRPPRPHGSCDARPARNSEQ